MRQQLVVIGNGMAGVRCVEEILKLAPDTFEITIFGTEKHPNYNRILLSKMLQGEHTFEHIILHDWSWYEQQQIQLYTTETVTHVDPDTRILTTASGLQHTYDILIFATGSVPFIPPIQGADKKGVISFRTVEDCEQMKRYAQHYQQAAVIGGGLLGLEAARGLLHLGMDTHVIHNAPYLMNRQLDLLSAQLLQQELEQQGMTFHLNENTTRITGATRAQGLRFASGAKLAVDLVVFAVGIRPHIRLAEYAGLHVQRGIVVNDYMQTSIEGIYAVGECAEHQGITYGLVAPLYEQGKVLAQHLCQQNPLPYQGSIPYSQLKISGVSVFSVGDTNAPDCQQIVQQYDGVRKTYKKVSAVGDRITGAILYGDTAEGISLLEMIKQGTSAHSYLQQLQSVDTSSATPTNNPTDIAAAKLEHTSTVCACNAVTKATILQSIQTYGLQTADEVQQHTQASGSCGGCRPIVEALVRYSLSGTIEEDQDHTLDTPLHASLVTHPDHIPVCSSISLTHTALKQQIQQHSWRTVTEVLTQLSSTDTPIAYSPLDIKDADSFHVDDLSISDQSEHDGCDTCITAIRYYLQLYLDSSLAIDHANLLPHLQILLDREWLAGYPDHLHTVDGSNVIEQIQQWQSTVQHLILPYPTRIAVAQNIYSPISVRVQDIGILYSPAGWEIYIGGCATDRIQEAHLLTTVDHLPDALYLIYLCLELYRYQAYYSEPVWKWVQRTEVLPLREQVLSLFYNDAIVDAYDRDRKGGETYDADAMSFLQRTM
ncbi:nitrite reductase (NADH) large subunit [Paenibacillus sp. SORGH_AS306]|uniref:FAD-dependent oxidoreductase n=1 Tax=unclassified Paenibacillus TaxID=185978 RepID=UPI00278B1195|nr:MULTISPECIES: FAD-dependent oxidoreductase [unclassified Paenibacillus]MDQ1232906.1 nitrite reductase (NADH) large subunit [Paenibacillus sp. SORGH_AS_0306]MDR6109953.1 nitrite reductase (NADH) large subunit [Paenibacillus sp. SORGH_AS_0338]